MAESSNSQSGCPARKPSISSKSMSAMTRTIRSRPGDFSPGLSGFLDAGVASLGLDFSPVERQRSGGVRLVGSPGCRGRFPGPGFLPRGAAAKRGSTAEGREGARAKRARRCVVAREACEVLHAPTEYPDPVAIRHDQGIVLRSYP